MRNRGTPAKIYRLGAKRSPDQLPIRCVTPGTFGDLPDETLALMLAWNPNHFFVPSGRIPLIN